MITLSLSKGHDEPLSPFKGRGVEKELDNVLIYPKYSETSNLIHLFFPSSFFFDTQQLFILYYFHQRWSDSNF